MNRVIWFVRPVRFAIKDVVRADVEELPIEFLRDTGDISRALAINGKRLFAVPLAPVHVRVSSREHNPVWTYLSNELPRQPYVADVHIARSGRNNLIVGPLLDKVASEQPTRTNDQNAHEFIFCWVPRSI